MKSAATIGIAPENRWLSAVARHLGVPLQDFKRLSPGYEYEQNGLNCLVHLEVDAAPDVAVRLRGWRLGSHHVRVRQTVIEAANESWDYSGFPDAPHIVFNFAIEALIQLVDKSSASEGPPSPVYWVFRSMILFQQITTLGVYLKDSLGERIVPHNDAMERFIEETDVLRKMMVPLGEACSQADLARNMVREHVQSQSNHNLAAIAQMYAQAFQIELWPEAQTKEHLFDAVTLSHQCLHDGRHGGEINSDGRLTKDFLAKTFEAVKSVVNHVDPLLRVVDKRL
jgi:hypothetical protein